MSVTREHTVWCDDDDCCEWVTFSGRSAAKVRKEARSLGWRFVGRKKDLCPRHARRAAREAELVEMADVDPAAARIVVRFLADELGDGWPLYLLCRDGDGSWAFAVLSNDTTSYVHSDGRVEWYGTSWVAGCSCDDAAPESRSIGERGES